MTGRVGGKANGFRSYCVSRGTTAPKTNNILARRIPAAPLEAAVFEMLRQAVLNYPGMEDAIKRLVAKEKSQKKDDTQNLEALVKQRDRRKKQLITLSDDVSVEVDDALDRKVTTVKAEIRSLDQRIAEARAQGPSIPLDTASVAKALAKNFQEFGHQMDSTDLPHVQRILSLLIGKMEADLETKIVEVEFSLPSWLGQVLARHGRWGLDELSTYKPFHEAHPENRVILAVFKCDKNGRPACFTCRRLSRAA